jgi:hypothetical protein
MKRTMIKAIVVAVTMIFSIFTFSIITFIILYEPPPDYNHVYIIDVDRTSDNERGLEFIDSAERMDYGSYLEIEPRENTSYMGMKPAGPRANYISKENLDHYTDLINDHEDNHTFGQYKLEYTASSDKVIEIKLRFRARTDFEGQSSGLYFNGRNIRFYEGVASNLLYHNGTNLELSSVSSSNWMDEEFEITYYNCYIIEMRMYYSSKPRPDEGGGFELFQYVVIDNDGDLKFIYNVRYDTGVLEDWMDTPW